MKNKIFYIMLFIILLLIPNHVNANGNKIIFILADELELMKIEELSSNNMSIGFVNLKTRPPYEDEDLFLTINTGRKLSRKEFVKLDKSLNYLGDLITTSSIGSEKENIIIGNRQGIVNYEENLMVYDHDWLIKTTNSLLDKTNILLVSFDIKNQDYRYTLLKEYVLSNKDSQIFILPKKVADIDRKMLNRYLVPILYFGNGDSGVLTSNSTRREGFIVLEDLSVEIKKTFGLFDETDIGNEIITIKSNSTISNFKHIYKETLNLLLIAYINHGLIYIGQALILISYFVTRFKKYSHPIYLLLTSNILTSLILGIFKLHRNIIIYLFFSFILSILITHLILKHNKKNIIIIYLSIYLVIALGTIFYPDMIYNSFIGFNNLIYGARYYGLNNGIMGVLLITSIFVFYTYKKHFFLLFPLNTIILSTYFGSNTGGFITSVILLVLIMCFFKFPKLNGKKNVSILILGGILLFFINIFIDSLIGERTHTSELVLRIKSFGLNELTSIVRFKLVELLKLSLLPPFSLVVIVQVLILTKFRNTFKEYKEIKIEVIITIITSIIGFLLNDTGVITFIYMFHFIILYYTMEFDISN